MDFRDVSLVDLAGRVRSKEVSARELVQVALDRIDAVDRTIGAFVEVDDIAALAAAADVDDRVARGEDPGPLAGVPIGVKDLEDSAGLPTTRGSKALEPYTAHADSELVARLKAAGCVVVGKTNTPELGWKPDTVNGRFRPTRNPFSPERSAGGSSGGTAAALAAGMIPLGTGSDGGGSIRIPSALCGMSGFKPSLGRVPSGGPLPADWPALSTKGPMARTTADIAYALDVVVAPDQSDLRSLPLSESSWFASVAEPHVPMRVAWAPTLGYAPVDENVLRLCERAIAVLADLGAEIVEVDEVFGGDPVFPWLTMTSAYNLRTLGHLRNTERWQLVDPGLAAQCEWAESVSAADFVRAEDVGHTLNARLVDLFHDVRLLVTPTTAASAPRLEEPGVINGGSDANWVRFTYPFNMTRSPAGTVCVGLSFDGTPIGVQLVGPQHGDAVVLRAMAALEQALGGPLRPADL